MGGNPLLEQPGDPVGQRASLAAPGPGDDERVARTRGDGGELLGVKLALEINAPRPGGLR